MQSTSRNRRLWSGLALEAAAGLRAHLDRLGALAMVAVVYLVAAARTDDARAIARSDSIRIRQEELPAQLPPAQRGRIVNASATHIAPWLGSVGAGAALGNIDGSGPADDACIVDPRSDSVAILLNLGKEGPRASRILLAPSWQQPGRSRPAVAELGSRTQAPMGCRLLNLNEDGYLDALVYFWGRPPLAFLYDGDAWHARDLLPGREEYWNTNTVVSADFDGDGHLDLFVGNYFADGDRVLDPDTSAGIRMNDSMSTAMNGGTNRFLLWRGAQAAPRPSVTYEEVATDLDAAVLRGWTLAAAAADLDGDLLPELYVANDFGPDRLLFNRSTPGRLVFQVVEGRSDLSTPRSLVLGKDSFKGMGAEIADLNRDGIFDIIVSNITVPFGLHESQLLFLGTGRFADLREGLAPFRYAGEDLGLARTAFAWDAKIADLDNDGRPEVIQATGFVRGSKDRWPEIQELALANDQLVSDLRFWPNLEDADLSGDEPPVVMTRQGASRRFVNVAHDAGVRSLGPGRGIASSDLDGDGDLDWITANQWAPFALAINDCPPGRGFIGLRILKSAAVKAPVRSPGLLSWPQATPAVGAVVRATLPGGVPWIASVDGGNGHGGQRSPEVHIGVGASRATEVAIQVAWRDSNGHIQRLVTTVPLSWSTLVLPW